MDDSGSSEEVTGRFVVDEAGESAIVRDVASGQVFTLADNPGFEPGAVVDATLSPRRPLGVAYSVVSVAATRTIPVAVSETAPTERVRAAGSELAVGESRRLDDGGEDESEGEGIGEIHVIGVESGRASERAQELADGSLTEAAARHDARGVELRWDESAGFVSVRYLRG